VSDFKAKCTKFDFSWGSAPDHTGGAYSAPPDPYLYLRGLLLRGGMESGGRGRGGEGDGKRKGMEGGGASPPNILA